MRPSLRVSPPLKNANPVPPPVPQVREAIKEARREAKNPFTVDGRRDPEYLAGIPDC